LALQRAVGIIPTKDRIRRVWQEFLEHQILKGLGNARTPQFCIYNIENPLMKSTSLIINSNFCQDHKN